MGWPAAHRSGSTTFNQGQYSGGFQNPKPANDNIRVPSPANDNTPRLPGRDPAPPKAFGRRLPPAAKLLARRSLSFARLVRFVPYLGWGLLAWDAYQLLRDIRMASAGGIDLSMYDVTSSCAGGGVPQRRSWNHCDPIYAPPLSLEPGQYRFVDTWQIDYTKEHPSFDGWYSSQPGLRLQMKPDPYYNDEIGTWPGINIKPAPQPVPWPAVDPFIFPPLSPMPEPKPLPRTAVPKHKPDPDEGDWSERGNSTNPRTRVRRGTAHRPQPPKKNEKERKSRVQKGASVVLAGGYAVTEGVDFIEALYDGVMTPWGHMRSALPEQFKQKSALSPQAKAKLLYEHWDKIDLQQALFNLAANQVIDLAVGSAAGNANTFATDIGITNHQGLLTGGVKVI